MNGNNMVPIAPAASYPIPKSIDIQRKKRTRAKRSCDKCRIKKTRCDAYLHQPCTKCKLSNYECTFLVEQKKRGPASGSYVEVLENRLQRMEKLLQNITKEKQSDTESDANSTESPPPDFDESSKASCSQVCLSATKEVPSLEDGLEKLTLSDYERTKYIGASSGVHFLNTELFNSNKIHRIPDDPKWVLQKLNQEEDEHVIIKAKKLTSEVITPKTNLPFNRAELFEDIPNMTQDFTDYLMYMFFTRVHNYCPVLNKVQFLEQYYFHKPTPPDKYIMYAVAHIAVSIFTPNIIHAQVFQLNEEQLKEIEDDLKVKAHQIVNFVYKRSMISTVQALMLLSMFMRRGAIDDEDTSHWFISGMAVRMAQDLGLHRDCSKWPIPAYEIEQRRRIWYVAYLMDRWVAADLGRPISIIDNDFEVEIPTPYELDYKPTQSEQMTPLLILEAEEARQDSKPIYASFVYLLTLSQIAGQVLVGLHSPRTKQTRDSNTELVNILDRNLAHWKESLPRELQVDMTDPNFYFSTMAGVVNLAYGCVQLLLYRPFIRNYSEGNLEDSQLAIKALGICTSTATEILKIVEILERDYFVALPWNMSVYCIFQAAIIFLHNAKGGNDFLKDHGKQNLVRCAKVYRKDPFLHNAQAIKVLETLVESFEVFLGESPSHLNKKSPQQSFGPLFGTSVSPEPYEFSAVNKASGMDYMLDSSARFNANSYFTTPNLTPQATSLPSNGTISSLASCGLPMEVLKTLGAFESTRPEGMFNTSLSLTLDKTTMVSPQQQSYPAEEQREFKCDSHNFDFNTVIDSQQQQTSVESHNQIDMASLCSQIPLWDIPSGMAWDEWESFMKTNTNM